MRAAELSTAAALMALAVFFMAHAVALPVLWVKGAGPGGGAFPFWLSLGMFACAAVIFGRELKPHIGPWLHRFRDETGQDHLDEAGSDDAHPFIDRRALPALAMTVAALVVTVGLMHWLGAYVAIPLFLLFYLRVVGKRGWGLTLTLTLLTPVALFLFFEAVLRILLPKGVLEPLFFPLYALIF